MVERAMGVNLKELEGKHSREMLRRRTGRILEKGWQEYKLHSVNKRSRGAKGSAPNATRRALEWEGYREARKQGKGGAVADTSSPGEKKQMNSFIL